MNIKNIILTVFGVALVSAIVYSSWQQKSQDKVELKLQLKQGESHELKLIFIQDEIFEINNRKQLQSKVRTEVTVGIDVPSVDANGTMNVELFYKAVKLEVNSPAYRIEFDSANPKPSDHNNFLQEAFAEVYSVMIGSKFSMMVTPMGQISDISGLDSVRAKLQEELIKDFLVFDINSIKDKDRDAVKKEMEMIAQKIRQNMPAEPYNSILSSAFEDILEMIDCIIVKFPDKILLSGNKWQDKSHLNLGFPVDANTTYTFRQRRDGCACIDAVADLDMGKDLKITEINSRETIRKRMSGARKSSIMVDETTGLLRKSEAVMLFSGVEKIEPDKMVLPIRPDATIPITVEGTMTIELIK